jgi:large conductance mechanosensitive channel
MRGVWFAKGGSTPGLTFGSKKYISGCGVTANIPVLGTGDSGFESRHPDNKIMDLNNIKNNIPVSGVKNQMFGFLNFVREQGVVGLAVGFILGGAVSKTVSSLVENVINPLVGLALGKVNLAEKMISVGTANLKYGAFISSIIDFLIVAAVIYFGVKWIGLDKLDKKKG